MMESLCGVMGMEIYNSKQEIGCRILLILVCTQKKDAGGNIDYI